MERNLNSYQDDASLIHNLPSIFVFNDDLQILEFRLIHINRDVPRSRGTLDKNEPPRFVLGNTQKIRFPIDLKIHFVSPSYFIYLSS